MQNKTVLKFEVKIERNDISTQVRVQQLVNGFVVKTGNQPIYYTTLEEMAEAVKQGLINTAWPVKGN